MMCDDVGGRLEIGAALLPHPATLIMGGIDGNGKWLNCPLVGHGKVVEMYIVHPLGYKTIYFVFAIPDGV